MTLTPEALEEIKAALESRNLWLRSSGELSVHEKDGFYTRHRKIVCLTDLIKALEDRDAEIERLKNTCIDVAELLAFALYHDVLENGRIGSITGIRAGNAWLRLPSEVRDLLPDWSELADRHRKTKEQQTVPFRAAMDGGA